MYRTVLHFNVLILVFVVLIFIINAKVAVSVCLLYFYGQHPVFDILKTKLPTRASYCPSPLILTGRLCPAFAHELVCYEEYRD